MRTKKPGNQVMVGRWPVSRWAALVMVISCITLVVPMWLARADRARSSGEEELLEAWERLELRPVEGRLAGDFPYRPPKPRTRTAAGAEGEVPLGVLAAVGKLELITRQIEGSSSRMLAAGYALIGDERRSIVQLEAELSRGQGELPLGDRIEKASDWRVLSDLAVAYHSSADRTARATDLLTAVAAAERAHTLAPRAPEAAWNRALTLEAIGLADEARQAWRDYLALDATSKWSDEARQRVTSLDWKPAGDAWKSAAEDLANAFAAGNRQNVAAIAGRFPVRSKGLIEFEWIPRWAEATQVERGALSLLACIESAAEAIRIATHDEQLTDWLAAERANVNKTLFVRSHARLAEAARVLRQSGTAEATGVWLDAVHDLRRSGSPMASTAMVDIAGFYYRAARHDEALQELARVQSSIDEHRWPLLAARAHWDRGVALTSIGRFGPAGNEYQRATELYERAGDRTHVGMLDMLIGHNAEMARDVEKSWWFYVDGLRHVIRYGDADRVLVVLDTFSRAALRSDQPGLAAILNRALTGRLGASGPPAYLCHALTTRCDIEARMGNRNEATTQCRAARQVWSSITDATVRGRLEVDLELSTAATESSTRRLDLLTRAIDVSNSRKDVYRLSRVFHLRGRAYAELGEARLARSDFEQGLALIEQQRERLDTVPDKLTYFETSEQTAGELVRLLVEGGEQLAALDVVERVRARALLDRLGHVDGVGPVPIESLRTRLEADRAIVEYWSGKEALYAWIIRAGGVSLVQVPVSRRTLEEATARFMKALSSEATTPNDVAAPAENLYGHLLGPLVSKLGDVETLTIIPDQAVAEIPFAALRDPSTKSYVVERFAVTQAPSASAFAAAHGQRERRDSILVVANPDTAEGLPELEIRGEIAAARRASRKTVVMTGVDARASLMRAAAPDADVVHVATHALGESRFGEPVLMLSPEKGDDGFLTASEVEETMTLRPGALVVLAACSTARGRKLSEGTMSIGRAFLAAGAGSVVASAWDAGDIDSGRIFAAFYTALSEGATRAAALRLAQLSVLKSEAYVHPRRWAAYQIYGGA